MEIEINSNGSLPHFDIAVPQPQVNDLIALCTCEDLNDKAKRSVYLQTQVFSVSAQGISDVDSYRQEFAATRSVKDEDVTVHK